MPLENKMRWAKLRVGLLAIVAMLILVALIVLITGQTHLFQSQAHLFTYMNDAAALGQGAPVNLNGIPIGKVKKIELSGSKDPRKVVRIDLEIPENTLAQIPTDSVSSISAANVLGTKYINIKKGQSNITVRDRDTLPSLNTAEFEDVVQQGMSILASLQGVVTRVDRIVGLIENGQGNIGKLLVDETLYNNLLKIVGQVQTLIGALNSDKGTLGKLIYDPALYNDVRGSLSRVDGLLQGLEEGQGTAGKFLKDPALYDQLQQTVTSVKQIADNINAGKGTVGKLLNSEELHDQLKASLAKMDLLLDKINSGQGTIGQLLVNPQMYDNLNGATRELHLLMKDFRANPRKFLRIKLSLF